jgi:hypothetical protein
LVHRRDTWKRFIKIIISQLPAYIAKYPFEEQKYLNDFFSVLQMYEIDTSESRTALANRFNELIIEYHNKDEYYHLPFLWFIDSYFTRANQLLSVARFHADKFYEYIVQHLRGNTQVDGAFQLIRIQTPLTDLKWEKLQYESEKLIIPLTNEEIHMLQSVYTYITNIHITELSQSHLKNYIKTQVKASGLPNKLHQLFTLLDAHWYIRINPAIFGLSYLYLHIQLKDLIKLEDIIDFHDPANTTLGASQIYQIKDDSTSFLGTILVPTSYIDILQSYIGKLEQRGKLLIKELSRVKNIQTSASLKLYEAEEGWKQFTKTEWQRVAQSLKTIHPRIKFLKLDPFFVTPIFKHKWNYKHAEDPNRIIMLFCKASRQLYKYKNLFLRKNKIENTVGFTKSELDFLEKIQKIGDANIGFRIDRLMYEFSLDNYWITTPPMSFEQLCRLISWLPLTRIVTTDYKASEYQTYQLWTVLTKKFVDNLINDLEWKVWNIVPIQRPLTLKKEWYNPYKHDWMCPAILSGN